MEAVIHQRFTRGAFSSQEPSNPSMQRKRLRQHHLTAQWKALRMTPEALWRFHIQEVEEALGAQGPAPVLFEGLS